VQISEATGLSVTAVAQAYYALGARLELWWLRERIVALPRDSRWASMARAALRDDVYAEQAALTHQVMDAQLDGAAPLARVEEWLAQNREGVDRCLRVLADIRTGGAVDLARLSVAVREVRNLINSAS
jgi:glutamate dehydrogenase